MVSVEGKDALLYYVSQHSSCLEVHMAVNEHGLNYPKIIQKKTKEMVSKVFKVFNSYNILIMDVLPEHEKWARSLGFEEGRNYDNLETLEGYKTYTLKRGDL